ncbi:uncharacterized protein LOC120333761 [Styela clava]|uniref:uncharacterized protein LOC120333761 n=1 Tax=Styela clava TaxID=7725 RepID=UPI00193930B1|nr:uncharacterized protein LOC120333761 [Styela clava]
MVLACSQEPIWTEHSRQSYIKPETISEYVLVSNPTKIEMAASSVYGTLPRAPKLHRRQMSEASLPIKYHTAPDVKERKKSFFAGLANKIKYAVDGKPSNQFHRKLQWSPSEDITSSTGNLHREYSPMPDRKSQDRPHRLWTRGLESVYASQRKHSTWKKPISTKKGSIASPEFASCTSSDCSSPTSSVPSSPESHRSFLTGNAKRARRSRNSNNNGYISNRDSFGSQSPIEETKKSAGNKILIVGAEGVGKSALTVRFLTKRFIGEYAPEIESIYDQAINLDGKDVNVHLWDSAIPDIHQKPHDESANSDNSTLSQSSSLMSVTSSGDSCRLSNRFSSSSLEDETVAANNNTLSRKNKLRHTINKTIRRFRSAEGSDDTDDDTITSSTQNLTEAERRLRWADAVVVVYSICDQSSFEAARDVIRYIRQTEAVEICRQGSNLDLAASRIPILLLGNKKDLEHRRRVDSNDAKKLASAFACSFTELSVSDSYEPISEAMKEHLKYARKVAKHRDGFKSKSRKMRR